MKNNKRYISILFLATLIGFSGCKEDQLDPITTLKVDRAFSPTGLTATVVNKISVKLDWKAVNNAKTYTIEIFENADFSGTPVKTIGNIAFTQVPYTVSGLAGDTQYAIRVKAAGEDVGDSKWVTATVKTDAEQIFNAVKLADISGNSAILTWPAGETATTITLSPGNLSHTVTPAEIAAGSATVTGLTGETNYTAKLLNGNKIRGTITFKTYVDIRNAKIINSVAEFNTALTTAVNGDILAVKTGNFDFAGATIAVTKSISVVAFQATERPVLNNLSFNVQSGASLKIKNLVIDGGATPTFAITYAAGNFGNLEIDGSVIKNYGGGILGLTSTTIVSTISSVLINNNVFSTFGAGGEFIDFRGSFANSLTFTNNTLYAQGAREFIRMDNSASASYPAAKVIITVSNNTLNAVASGGKRLFYVRIPAASHEIYFTKNIVASTDGLLANQAQTNLVTLSGNNYFTAPNMVSSATVGVKVDASGTTLDPGFKSPATGDFTISQVDLKANGIGDPRWR
ncbi:MULTISPECIES: DUF4957 domain-containing protein [Pedobacter]|nr:MULTISPECIES: DUF4957 domain-containing protein [Pedobacter]MBB5441143.1 hypothetical protein [Pedobacter sp. AK017]